MSRRSGDWFRQAERDLADARRSATRGDHEWDWFAAQQAAAHARRSVTMGDHEWACFAAQQAAEKALNALLQHLGGEVRGHSALALLRLLPAAVGKPSERDALPPDAIELDRHDIPARYPNRVPQGAPFEFYDAEQSERAVAAADRILGFCSRHLA